MSSVILRVAVGYVGGGLVRKKKVGEGPASGGRRKETCDKFGIVVEERG